MSDQFTKAAGVVPYPLFGFRTELLIVENLILQTSYRFTVRESAPVNYQVATIRARDEDSFSFGPISFALGGGLDRDDFKLNQPVSFIFSSFLSSFLSLFSPFPTAQLIQLHFVPQTMKHGVVCNSNTMYVIAVNQTLLVNFNVGIGFYF